MQEKIEQQITHLQSKNFIISDKEKATGYLKQVGIYRLSRYFSVFKSEIENGEQIDFQRIIDCYVFDKRLRMKCMHILESLEVYLKNILILYIGENYKNSEVYRPKFAQNRINFIREKTKNQEINAEQFFHSLSFGEVRKIFDDLLRKHKKFIADEFGIPLKYFENWIECMVYLRNLCSHSENVFNRSMILIVSGDFFGIEHNHRFVAYLLVLQIFKRIIFPNYHWEEGILRLMSKYNIATEEFFNKKITPLSEQSNQNIKFGTEAWEVFVDIIYTKYVKK